MESGEKSKSKDYDGSSLDSGQWKLFVLARKSEKGPAALGESAATLLSSSSGQKRGERRTSCCPLLKKKKRGKRKKPPSLSLLFSIHWSSKLHQSDHLTLPAAPLVIAFAFILVQTALMRETKGLVDLDSPLSPFLWHFL
ncbi:hypothetical protein JCGZ_03190 [Jatropha curcas]|uniref:Uncharacterized protein n=1 Tax=Jatropha curcas TaxID=180498 RepID=A0A067L4I0_JATCU|nr:hypothetical protein JCGZ_03190 [Jatropha curcas]